jgi:hypothetical protein
MSDTAYIDRSGGLGGGFGLGVEPTIASGGSPNIGNYYVGRGICYVQLVAPTVPADGALIDCGNVTEFTFQVKPTRLEHYSSRVGVRKKDLVVVTEVAATLTMIMEEFTARNFGMAVLGNIDNSQPPSTVIQILSQPLIYGHIKFQNTNAVGPQYTYDFPLCLFTPSKAISLLPTGSGTWGSLDFECDVLFNQATGSFGTIAYAHG